MTTTDAPVAWIGTAQSPEGNADVLEVKNADGVATRLFLDVTTHMPLMLTWRMTKRGAHNVVDPLVETHIGGYGKDADDFSSNVSFRSSQRGHREHES